MTFENLQQFITTEDKRLKKRFRATNHTTRVLARTVKLMEEAGELCDAVLASMRFQRKEKLKERDGRNVEEEVADVIITTLLLAKEMGIDVERSLEEKTEKVNKRYP